MGSLQFNFDEEILKPTGEEVVRAVFTQPKREGSLYAFCRERGMVCYLPLQKVARCKRHSYKEREYQYQEVTLRPMFPGYAFVKLLPQQRSEIFRSNAILRILGENHTNHEKLLRDIRVVHQVECIAMESEVEFNADLKEGDRFLIESGPWQGICGWLTKKNKRTLWTVEIECLNTLVRATIDPSLYKMTPVEE